MPTLRFIGAVALTLVTGCVDAEPDVPMGAGLRVVDAPVTMNVCADGPTVFGIDVSKWQGSINWAQVKNAGVKYAFIRVSNGTGIIDEYFETNWAGAGAQGILRGVYQYFRPNQDAVAQANLLLNKLAAVGGGELPPVIDVESVDGQSPATIAARVGQWINRVEGQLGVKPIIYTGSYFWDDRVQSSAFSTYPLWGAHWGVTCPTISSAWTRWTFHQYSESGTVAGVTGPVDLDRFNGTLAQLRALGADPECTANPGYIACDGTVRVSCDASNHLTESPCGAGKTCTTSGGLRCISTACAGSPNARTCVTGTRLGRCSNGNYTEVDCGADGGTCSEAGGSGHCVAFACHSQLGGEDGAFCVDQTHLATCAQGAYSEAACPSGQRCSDVGGSGHCVDTECWAPWSDDADRTFCADAITLGRCAGGTFTTTACGVNKACDDVAKACVDQGTTPVDEDPMPDTTTDTGSAPDTAHHDAHPDDDTGPATAPDDTGLGEVSDTAGPGTRTVGVQVGRPSVDVEARRYPGEEGCAGGGPRPIGWLLFLVAASAGWLRRRRQHLS